MGIEQALYFLGLAVVLTGALLLYFKVADKYNIIDKPNERSSHTLPVIRGGGVVFILAILLWFYYHDFVWPWFVAGAVVIAVISFLDDVTSLNPLIRFLVQLAAVVLMFYELWPIHWPVSLLIMAVVVCIGTLNAFNFMDGINGITGVYALVCLATFGYIQWQLVPFTDLSLIVIVSMAVVIFLFFNFRARARCFAGDVGSVTIAFVLIFVLLQLIHVTHNLLWPLVFLVYGTDSIVTIMMRIKRKENIFNPHRTHLYQYMSNELRWSHRSVSLLYGGIQLSINLLVIPSLYKQEYLFPIVVATLFVMVYAGVRFWVVNQVTKPSF